MSKYRYRAIAKIIRVIKSCVTIGQLGVALKMLNNYGSKTSGTFGHGNYYFMLSIYQTKLEELINESI